MRDRGNIMVLQLVLKPMSSDCPCLAAPYEFTLPLTAFWPQRNRFKSCEGAPNLICTEFSPGSARRSSVVSWRVWIKLAWKKLLSLTWKGCNKRNICYVNFLFTQLTSFCFGWTFEVSCLRTGRYNDFYLSTSVKTVCT